MAWQLSLSRIVHLATAATSAITAGPDRMGWQPPGEGSGPDVGGLLLDCKATINPRNLGASEVYQLAGYLLLDYDAGGEPSRLTVGARALAAASGFALPQPAAAGVPVATRRRCTSALVV